LPLRARTWWQAPRACGPSAPSAEKARPASPISDALVGKSGTAHRLSSTTGAPAAPKDHAEPDCPGHPPATPGLAVWSRAPEAPRPVARSGGVTRHSRRDPGCEQPRPRRAAPLVSSLTAVLRQERGAGTRDRVESTPQLRGAPFEHEMRRTFRRTTHFSKNEYPSSTSPTGTPRGISPGSTDECRVSWRFTRFGTPKLAR
jgi:hypothetical protein